MSSLVWHNIEEATDSAVSACMHYAGLKEFGGFSAGLDDSAPVLNHTRVCWIALVSYVIFGDSTKIDFDRTMTMIEHFTLLDLSLCDQMLYLPTQKSKRHSHHLKAMNPNFTTVHVLRPN